MSSTENNYIETDLGNIALSPCGEYDDSTLYEYLDMVSYQGGSYFCTVDFPQKISGIAPEPGKNTEMWQMLTLPGDMTPEYIALHDEVVNKAKQVESSRAAVELSQQEVDAAQADVQQMRQDTQEAAEQAIASRDSAAGYAQSAETSRTAAKESEDNINALITGFDMRVTEKTSEAETAIAEARQTAVNAVSTKRDGAVQAVMDEGNKQIKAVQAASTEGIDTLSTATQAAVNAVDTAGTTATDAVKTQQATSTKAVTDEGTKQVTAISKAGAAQISAVEKKGTEQIIAVNTAGETQTKAVSNAGDAQMVILSETAAQELVKLQEVAAQFAEDHEQIETNKTDIEELKEADVNLEDKINKKIQVWFPGKTIESSTINTKVSVLSDTGGNAILDIAGNEIATTAEVVAPAPPYWLGDLWISDDAIYVCTATKTEGNFNNFNWMKILERR